MTVSFLLYCASYFIQGVILNDLNKYHHPLSEERRSHAISGV